MTEGDEFNFEDENQSLNQSLDNRQQNFAAPADANQFFTHKAEARSTAGQLLNGPDPLAEQREDIELRDKVLKDKLLARGDVPTNQLRFGGNYMNVNDPNKPPYSFFYLMINGHVQSGTFDDQDGICCQYDIVGGSQEWHLHSVSKTKQTALF